MLRAPELRAQITVGRLWPWPLVWVTALTRPAVATYRELCQQPQATALTAYRWLLVGSASSGAIMAASATLRQIDQPGDPSLPLALSLYTLLALVSWVLFAGCTHWLAQRFAGQGAYAELLYTFATFSAPLSLITTLLSLLPHHRLATLCLYGYWFFLYVVAVQAVYGFSWRRASGVLLLALGGLTLLALMLLAGLGYLLL